MDMQESVSDERRNQLASLGARAEQMDELLAYTSLNFDVSRVLSPARQPPLLPLPSEPYVDVWRRWMADAEEGTIFEALRRHLPQLNFPIAEGMSQTDGYQNAVLRGESVAEQAGASGLPLEHAEGLRLVIQPTAGGEVPVLLPHGRTDFETLVRALGGRCEPVPVRPTMGACTVKGFNNWERIRAHRELWLAQGNDADGWDDEFMRLREDRAAYQDRFLILSDGNYADIAAADAGLSPSEWRAKSIVIRLRHECTHYATLRLFGSTRNNAHDEIVADFVGYHAAFGKFNAALFLRGMGLEAFPAYRASGRLEQYRAPLSDAALSVLCALLHAAAPKIEQFDTERPRPDDPMLDELAAMTALCGTPLELLAADGAVERLMTLYQQACKALVFRAR